MKKNIFIILGITLILAAIGVWLYLFLYVPSEDSGPTGSFPDGGGGAFSETGAHPSVVDTSDRDAAGNLQALRQLTTKPVSAATFIDGGVRYVERGTGYIYDIQFSDGNETQVTNTTIPRVVEAVFSKSGNRVAMTSEEQGGQNAIVGTITKNDSGEGVIDGTALPEGSRELAFSESGDTIYFLNDIESGTRGYSYDLLEQTQSILFSLPLSQINVLWGEDPYVYTLPASEQKGYLYEVTDSGLSYVIPGALGLTAARLNDQILVSASTQQAVETSLLKEGELESSPLHLFLEKCVGSTQATSTIYCAAPETIPPGTYPDDWYKGVTSFTDSLWRFNTQTNEVEKLVNLLEESAREIDVARIYQDDSGDYLAFINKNDDTLWLYELDLVD